MILAIGYSRNFTTFRKSIAT